ncbi:hypothetical protein HanRHA438_Chr15g0700491 [Helianthus annuus]|nr:hypothetical protein HanRHA438_Chr15g0700491 [Helianthus annuus]
MIWAAHAYCTAQVHSHKPDTQGPIAQALTAQEAQIAQGSLNAQAQMISRTSPFS